MKKPNEARSEKNKHRITFVSVGLIGTFVFWLVAVTPVFLLATFLPESRIPILGSAGDMFGASSALFSGLGFFGLVLVLHFDLRERRRDLKHREEDLKERKHSRTPFLVPSITEEGALVVRATKLEGGYTEVTISLSMQVENISDEPAMNVSLAISAPETGMPDANIDIDDTPFGKGDSGKRPATARFSCSGKPAESFLNRLNTGSSTSIEVNLCYDSINGTRWGSGVYYEISSIPRDRSIYRQIIDNDSSAFIEERPGLIGADQPFLDFTVVANSWTNQVVRE